MVLILTSGILLVSGEARVFLSDSKILELEVQGLKRDMKTADLQKSLVEEQLWDYQQSVASLLGDSQHRPQNWAQMNLLTQVRSPASVEGFDRSGELMASAKENFNRGEYSKAAEGFSQLLGQYPVSPAALEARFLRAESLYLAGRTDQCVEQIQEMITQFPDHPMTGFLMLRLGQILRQRNRNAEAVEILQMIRRGFPQEETLQREAKSLEGEFRVL